jgi:cytoskeletal protein RodZ
MSKLSKKVKVSRRPLTILIAVVVLVGLIGGTYLIIQAKHPAQESSATKQDSSVYPSALPQDNNDNNTRKSSPSSAAQTLDNGPSVTSSTANTGNISVTITRVAITNSALVVGTLVDGTTSGTCTLSVSQTGQQTITSTNTVVQQNNAYACPNFNVPINQFPNQGNWNVSISLTSGGATVTNTYGDNPVNLSGSSQ